MTKSISWVLSYFFRFFARNNLIWKNYSQEAVVKPCHLLVGIETEYTIEKHQYLVSSVDRKIVTAKEGATKQAAQIQRCDQHYKQLIKKAAEFSVETW